MTIPTFLKRMSSDRWTVLRLTEELPVYLADGPGWLKVEIWEQLLLLVSSGNAEGGKGQLSSLASQVSVPFARGHILHGSLKLPRCVHRLPFGFCVF